MELFSNNYSMWALCLILVAGIAARFYAGRKPYPPGPVGWPLIGNALQLPERMPWRTYLQWSRDYDSDVIHFTAPGAHFVVLNSASSVYELLVKRSSMYSGRPHSNFLHDMMDFAWTFVFMDYGETWKKYRKVFHQEYEVEEHQVNRSQELVSARRLLKRLLTSKGMRIDPDKDLRLAAADTILSVTYGISPRSESDPFIKIVGETTYLLSHAATGGYLVDYFHVLKAIPSWFPGAAFKRSAERGRFLSEKIRSVPMDFVKSEMAQGRAKSSVASRLLASAFDEKEGKEAEDDISNILGTAYVAGADTTVAMIGSFILAMALHPEVQRKAQKAIDAALGQGERLPDFADYGTIPYLDAVVDEVLRWNPMSPLGLFHSAAEDDFYKGYFIPKGAIVIPNGWALLHDQSVYGADALDFRPERFMSDDGLSRRKDAPDIENAFGYGRRKCPGRIVARDTVWITAASLLTAFNIVEAFNKDGRPFAVDEVEFTSEMISRPPQFTCIFEPRSSATESLIEHDVGDANMDGPM